MEKLGFHVPDLARNVALQEEKFLEYCSGLENSLSRYHSLLASLTEAEVHVLVESSPHTRSHSLQIFASV